MPALRCILEPRRGPILARRRAAEVCEIARWMPESALGGPCPISTRMDQQPVRPLRLRRALACAAAVAPLLLTGGCAPGRADPPLGSAPAESVHPSACEAERMTPVRDLRGVSFYTDAAKSVADPVLKQAADEAVRPLWDFVKAVDALVDVGSAPAQDCALQALAAWARGGALLGQANQQGGYEREMA